MSYKKDLNTGNTGTLVKHDVNN